MLGKFCNAEFVLNLYKFPMLFIGKKREIKKYAAVNITKSGTIHFFIEKTP